MKGLFLKIYDFLSSRPALRWGLLLFAVAALAIASTRMRVKEDIGDFLPADKRNADVSWAFTHLNNANRVVVTLSAAQEGDGDVQYLLMDAVDTLEAYIERLVPEEYISSLVGRIDSGSVEDVTDFVLANLPYYLTEEDYARLDSMLAQPSLEGQLQADRSIVASPGASFMRAVVTRDPLLLSTERLKSLEGFKLNDSFSLTDDYIFTEDGCALLTVDLAFGGSDTMKGEKFIRGLDEAMARCEAAFGSEVKCDALGSIYIAQTNASQLKKDSVVSIVIAVALIALLLVVFFRRGRSILLVGVAITFGFLLAFGCTALIRGSISLIVIGMGAVIIGIAANYPLHFLAHIKQGYSPRESLSDIVLPLTTGNITTVGAFLSLMFLSSPAMRDLGLFAALLLVGTILFSLIFLPHMVGAESPEKTGLPSWGGMSRMRLETNKFVILAVVLVTIALSFFDDNVRFETSLHNINYMTERQKANMGRMLSLAQGGNCVTYIAVTGEDANSAMDNYQALLPRIDSLAGALPEGAALHGVRDFIPSRKMQQASLGRWNSFVASRGEETAAKVGRAASAAGFKEGAFSPFLALLDGKYEVEPAEYFSPIKDNLASSYFITDSDRSAVLTIVTSPEDCTAAVADLLKDEAGVIVFDGSTLTGEMVRTLSDDFDKVLYICAFIVFALLLVSFGRAELALIAFLPLTIGWIWILGIMSLCGINFNIVNIILATFIFGMGDDYTIFITEGAMYEHTYGKKMLDTYKSTIILSALIMFVGIGALIFAKHPAMLSLSYVIMIGMFTVVLMAIIVPPFIYRWLTERKGRRRSEPLTLVNLSATLLAFVLFLIGSVIITLAGFFLITCTFGSKRGKDLYHSLLCFVAGLVYRGVFFTRSHLETGGETFEKPAVIVANHQSHLDLMALLQLTPKMIVLTNKWVWNNPFYGILIRYAEFCPVEDILSGDLSRLDKKIKEGYSVLVFPEGTRTVDGSIGRFQGGAFYLAEKYSLDILPVVLHGINDVLPKVDFLLRKGEMFVRVMGRIHPADTSFGEDYRERAKLVRQHMVRSFEALASERETADYFAPRVIHNYIYKGADIERAVRRSMKASGNFRELSEALPRGGRVLFLSPLLGEPSLVCALCRKDLQIDAVIEDEMTRSLASCCEAVPANLHYLASAREGVVYDAEVVFEDGGYRIK